MQSHAKYISPVTDAARAVQRTYLILTCSRRWRRETMPTVPSGTVTFVFSDIEDSTSIG
ncbi:hypothetical protein BH23CHL10_BH23CHL10_16860 [soil metagenome]